MFQNPILRTILLFLGAFCALNFLAQIHPLLWLLAVIGSGLITLVLWLRTYDAGRLARWCAQPIVDRVAATICRWAGLQPPTAGEDRVAVVGAAAGQPVAAAPGPQAAPGVEAKTTHERGLLLRTDADWQGAQEELHGIAHGHEDVVARLVGLLHTQVRIREKSQVLPQQPPIATALLIGPPGIGKRFVAEQLGRLLYGDDTVVTIDLGEDADHLVMLLDAVRRQPRLTIVLDNVQRASPGFLERLQAIVGRGFVREAKDRIVDFRHTFVLAISECDHEAAAAAAAAGDAFGLTVEMKAVADATSLNAMLASLLGQVFWFQFPETGSQVQVIAQLMQQEALRANLELAYVDPAVLHREVKAAGTARSFALSGGRISRLMRPAIAEAHARGQRHLDLLPPPAASSGEVA
ncbi:MAG: hypothetical protein IT455_20385 [Planctomycetes bacterium]|nr:hypothetical protein [Planctomycetota bacterium]